jgi:hypothetical protein
MEIRLSDASDLLRNNSSGRLDIKNQYGESFKYPGDRLIAKTHSKTTRIGEYDEGYKIRCECCNQLIPNKFYNVNAEGFKLDKLFRFGIDLVNFFIITRHYYYYIFSFYLTYLLQSILIIFTFGVPNEIFDFYYLELYYQILIYGNLNGLDPDPQSVILAKFYIDFGFNIVRLMLVIYIFFGIKRKFKIVMKDYKRKLSYNYLDESLFAVTIKNLPKIVAKDELKQFLIDEYGIETREIYLLKCSMLMGETYENFEKLLLRKKTMEVTHVDKKYTDEEFNIINRDVEKAHEKLLKLLDEADNIGTAIVIVEKMEDKVKLFRDYYNLGIYCLCNSRKPNTFRGKRIYFEVTSSLDYINWRYMSTSIEKQFTDSYFNSIFSTVSYLLFSALVFMINYVIAIIPSLKLNLPLVKPLIMIILNIVLEMLLVYGLKLIKTSDRYAKQVSTRYIIMQKTFMNTIILFILINQYKIYDDDTYEYYDFIYFVYLMVLRGIVLTRFSEKYFINKLRYLYSLIFRRKLIQYEMNELCSDNIFNIMKVFEYYRINVYTALLLMKLYPLSALVLIVLIFIHYFVIRYSLYHSSLRHINHYGYYFQLTFKHEMFSLFIIIFISNVFASVLRNTMFYIIVYFFVSEVGNILLFKFNFKQKFTEKNYTDYFHDKEYRKFADQKFVNLQLLKNEIDANYV